MATTARDELRLVSNNSKLPSAAARLAAVRKMRGLSLNVAAEVTGVCRQTIKDAEAVTSRQLRGRTLAKIAHGYQVDLALLDPGTPLPRELPVWKEPRPRPATTSKTAPVRMGWAADLAFAEWLDMTKRTHASVCRTCETIASKISDQEGELASLRVALTARQQERATLERALA